MRNCPKLQKKLQRLRSKAQRPRGSQLGQTSPQRTLPGSWHRDPLLFFKTRSPKSPPRDLFHYLANILVHGWGVFLKTMFGLRSWRLGNLREFFIFQPSAVIHLYLPKDMKLGPLKDASLFFIRHRQRRRRKSSKQQKNLQSLRRTQPRPMVWRWGGMPA